MTIIKYVLCMLSFKRKKILSRNNIFYFYPFLHHLTPLGDGFWKTCS